MALIVNEIFYSIQGESLFAGLPCIFVRLTGCNLRCTYCDTRYAYTEGTPLAMSQIIGRVAAYCCRLIEITGGEPLHQKETPDLVQALIVEGYTVLLETNGTYDLGRLDHRCIKIIDIKCPGSGESKKNEPNNLIHLNPADQVKFVIGDREDYIYARDVTRRVLCDCSPGHILFSPVHDKLAARTLAEWMLKDNLNVRLHPQLHKYIWPDKDRGV